ncbi:hypothetical protein ACT7DO_14125 [Bacillus pacificus]
MQIPDVKNEKNFEFLTIPKLGSFFYTNSFDGEIVGLKDIPKRRSSKC